MRKHKTKIILLALIVSIIVSCCLINRQTKITKSYISCVVLELEEINSISDNIINSLSKNRTDTQKLGQLIEDNHCMIYEKFKILESNYPGGIDRKINENSIMLRSDRHLTKLNRVERLHVESVIEYYGYLGQDINDLIKKKDEMSNVKWLNALKDFLQSGRF